MKKRHINEFMHTSFADSGMVSGMGILYDRYDDEYNPNGYVDQSVMVIMPSRTKEEREALDGPVIIKRLEDI